MTTSAVTVPPNVFQKLVVAFNSESSTLAAQTYVKSLHTTTLSAIIKRLRSPPSNISSVTLLRALWSSSTLRPTILTIFADNAPSEYNGLEQRLLEEIELLLVCDARDISHTEKERLRGISICATAILKHSRTKGSCHHGQLLVFCARAAGKVNIPQARQVKLQILQCVILFLQSEKNLGLRTVMALLDNELHLEYREERIMLRTVFAFVTKHCEQSAFPFIFRAVLQSLGRAQSRAKVEKLGLIALIIVQKAKGESLSDIFVILEILVLDSDVICHRITDALASITRMPNDRTEWCHEVKLCASHVAVMYCLLGVAMSENIRDTINNLLQKVLLSPSVSFDTSIAASSSSSVDPQFHRRVILLESIKIPAIKNRCPTILDFYESQIWQSNVDGRYWGKVMFFELFVWISESRASVLQSIFSALTEARTPPHVLEVFCSMFEEIAGTAMAAFSLREYKEELIEGLKSVVVMPADIDSRIMTAIVPVAMSTPVLNDALFLFLRKIAGSRARKIQCIVCAGLLAVVEQDNAPPGVLKETCDTLELILQFSDVFSRSYCIHLLLCLVERNPACLSRLQSVSNLLLQRFMVMQVPLEAQSVEGLEADRRKSPAWNIDFTRVFVRVGAEYVVSDPIPYMIRYCEKVHRDINEAKDFFARYISYLGHVEGAIRDACDTSKSSIPIAARIKLLCDQFETVLGLGLEEIGPSHVQIYAASIIIRDFVASKVLGSDSSSQGNGRPAMSKLVRQLASLTAREASTYNAHDPMSSRKRNHVVVPLNLRVSALENLEKVSKGCFHVLNQVVLSEILMHIQRYFANGVLYHENEDLFLRASRKLPCYLRSYFVSTNPWAVVCDSVLKDNLMVSEVTDEPESSAKNASAVSQAGGDECNETLKFLSTLVIFNSEVKKALEAPRIILLEGSTRIMVRQCTLKTLLRMISHGMVGDEISVLFDFLRHSLAKNVSGSGCAILRESRELLNASLEETGISYQKRSAVVTVLSNFFRLEFANSLSIGLTLSYLELMSHLIARKDDEEITLANKMRDSVSSMLWDVLREYSIRHTSVMREMLTLLLTCYEEKKSIQFFSAVLYWLCNDPVLLSSKFTYQDDGHKREELRVDEFDQDIIDEAIAIDCGLKDADDDTSGLLGQDSSSRTESNELNAPQHNADFTDQIKLRSPLKDLGEGKNPLKQLCLNETPEISFLTINCILSYCNTIIVKSIRQHREVLKNEHCNPIDTSNIELIVTGLTAFLGSAYIKTMCGERTRWPLVFLKKVGNVLFSFMELLELQLRFLLLLVRRNSSSELCIPPIETCTCILILLYQTNPSQIVLCSISALDRNSKRSALQERINVIIGSLFQAARSRVVSISDKTRKAVTKMTRIVSQSNSIPRTSAVRLPWASPGGKDNMKEADTFRVSRPHKRQRLRSRNRDVDEWLRDEKGEDNFADLEDFVIPMEARDL